MGQPRAPVPRYGFVISINSGVGQGNQGQFARCVGDDVETIRMLGMLHGMDGKCARGHRSFEGSLQY